MTDYCAGGHRPPLQIPLFEFVFFPPDVANRTCPPAFFPMSEVGHGVLGSATEALRLRHDLYVLDFAFRHS